ncbi:MAG: DEAD/DEAH box helicase [Raoultibacter sp.]
MVSNTKQDLAKPTKPQTKQDSVQETKPQTQPSPAQHKELIAIFTPTGFLVDEAATKPATKPTAVFYDEHLLQAFRKAPYAALYDFGFLPPAAQMAASLAFLHDIARAFVEAVAHDSDVEILRRARSLPPEVFDDLLQNAPFALGMEYVDAPWMQAVWDQLGDVFNAEVAATKQLVADYLRTKSDTINVVGRVFFHLVEHASEDFPFAFLATYSTGDAGVVNHLPLKNALLEYEGHQEKLLTLLSTVSRAVDKSAFISGLVETGEIFHPLKLTAPEARVFLSEIQLYEACGIVCRIPNWWRKKTGARVALSVGGHQLAGIGLKALLACDPQLYLDGVPLTREEVADMLGQVEGLSFIKNKWVEVDHAKLQQLLVAFDAVGNLGDMTLADALRMQMGIERPPSLDDEIAVEVSNGEWLEHLRSVLLEPARAEHIVVGKQFKAQLRPYQQEGLNWLCAMQSNGLGALLADDMGLGKTVQLLALLDYRRTHGGGKTLLVLPASLLHNWQKEAEKFAPKLRCRVVHAAEKEFSLEEADLFITTYGMAARLESLQAVAWDMLIIDEAQAIKNPGTKQTRALKQIEATARVALTGTPIENKLSDLWSIFDFLNQGLLGTGKEFTAFTNTLKSDHAGYAKLKTMVSPFILRRLKTDKSVISDLPEKVEMKTYTTLTRKQAALYNALVKDLEASLDASSGIARKGLVLSSIMKFKQICNHPDHYTGQREFKAEYSGKFAELAQICETVREKREKMLVFTQFREMADPLARYLEAVFGAEGLVLHGQTPVKARGRMADRFNSDEYLPFMVLSLKAGGVGLNLTAANHVVHFDRWWNPAVENQANDRAFRIGQTKNVLVHKFVTTGTLEEKIDALLEQKQKLADDIIASSGESWITEMSNEDLINLVTLGGIS